ncbi:radical SAM/SPASM domain-containing protein [Oribacterium sp. WCC10]|uniref:radical SAM/SPASM domain-containing protein n=1 Tax=Oribacterium sp. WCC10 TaxID=1855343 RepID=UPI0008F36D73|nr:radical SAM/SPASM domain-containing protein [Oribacterium sp. WCC10]SFG25525.1 radical SAM additional 4Fe4S-binding SPASM domain-containing protein [Oribacterium sp. WCC10]
MIKHSFRVDNIKLLASEYRKCYMFGAGFMARTFIEYLGGDVKDIIDAIIVSDKNNNPDSIGGVLVVSLGEIKDIDNCLIIVAMYDKNISKILGSKGFNNLIYIDQVMPSRNKRILIENSTVNHEINRYIEYFENEKPLFKYVEIETVNRCNGLCEFCPVNANAPQREYRKMEKQMFYSIISQLSEIEHSGLLALFSNNEPFIDERISEFVKYARQNLPKAFIYLLSNGTLLNEIKFKETIPYLDLLQIDDYKNNDLTGVKLLVQKYPEYDRKVRFCEIEYNSIRESRGGNSPNNKIYYTTECGCQLPWTQIVIRPDGKVSLCCNDSLGEMTLGNLNEERLVEIWHGEKYSTIRNLLKKGRENLDLCRYCNHKDKREIWDAPLFDKRSERWEERIFPSGFVGKEIICIYGVSDKALMFYSYLKDNGITVKYFLDNGYEGETNATIIDSKKCYLPIEISCQANNVGIYIVTENELYEETFKELKELGFFDIRMVF